MFWGFVFAGSGLGHIVFGGGIMAMAAGFGGLIKHFRFLVALLLAADVEAESEGEEEESSGLFHGSERGVVNALHPRPARRLQPECPCGIWRAGLTPEFVAQASGLPLRSASSLPPARIPVEKAGQRHCETAAGTAALPFMRKP